MRACMCDCVCVRVFAEEFSCPRNNGVGGAETNVAGDDDTKHGQLRRHSRAGPGCVCN